MIIKDNTALYEITALVKPRDKRHYVRAVVVKDGYIYTTSGAAACRMPSEDTGIPDGWYSLEKRNKSQIILEPIESDNYPDVDRIFEDAMSVSLMDHHAEAGPDVLIFELNTATGRPWTYEYIRIAARNCVAASDIRASTGNGPTYFECIGFEMLVMPKRFPGEYA